MRQSAKEPACPGIYNIHTERHREASVTVGSGNILTHLIMQSNNWHVDASDTEVYP